MKIKEMRKRLQLTQGDLAKQLGTTQQTIARWESGKTELSVSQLKDLAVALSCTVPELLGRELTRDEERRSPFAKVNFEIPYGTLEMVIDGVERSYPIDEVAKSSLLTQLNGVHLFNATGEHSIWLTVRTLDDKILFANTAAIETLKLVSDDVEPMPQFFHPEAYAALRDWNENKKSEVLANEARELVEGKDEGEIMEMATSMKLHFRQDRRELRTYLTDYTATELEALDMHSDSVSENAYLIVEEDGSYQKRFVNLSSIGLIEVPADYYLHLLHSLED